MSYYPEVKDPTTGQFHFPYPYSLDPIPQKLLHSMIPVGTFALMSVISTFSLLCFLIFRTITWRNHYAAPIGYNQYVVLVVCLLLADMQQSAGFLISLHWIHHKKILAPSSPCFAQGWLIHSGDVASGFFVLAIALHTFHTAIQARVLAKRTFYSIIASIWLLAYLLTAIGVAQHTDQYFVRAGAWCWVSSAYEPERLALHYIWVFIVEFGTVFIYVLIWVRLERQMKSALPASKSSTHAKIRQVIRLMMLYPAVYVILTLPLAAGRMWSMSHHGANLPDVYQCIAGALITSCGWVDSLLYTLTRKSLLKNSMPNSSSGNRSNTGGRGSGNILHTRTITVTKDDVERDADDRRNISLNDMLQQGPKTTAIAAKHRRGRSSSSLSDREPSPAGSLDPIITGHYLGKGAGTTKVEITVGEVGGLHLDEE